MRGLIARGISGYFVTAEIIAKLEDTKNWTFQTVDIFGK
jgi:hypothetical protein